MGGQYNNVLKVSKIICWAIPKPANAAVDRFPIKITSMTYVIVCEDISAAAGKDVLRMVNSIFLFDESPDILF